MKNYQIKAEEAGQRLDQFLQTILKDVSRNHITQQIKSGQIKVNNQTVKAGYMIKAHDVIEIEDMKPKSLDLTPVDLDLNIVYEDDDLMVIDKPSGLVVHPAASYKGATLVHGLLHLKERLSSINGTIRPGIVHRIDKDTSGLLVIAKNDQTHQKLSEDLKLHQIKRQYLALIYGKPDVMEGKIDAPIKRSSQNRLKMAVDANGKHAVTYFKVLQNYEKYSLISCDLETGRTHQIRVHMAFIHHPIVGDPLYGPKPVIGNDGQLLHAYKLEFMHPNKKEMMTFQSDIPQYFQKFIDSL